MKTKNSVIESFKVICDDNGLHADVIYNDSTLTDLNEVEKQASRLIIRDGFDLSLISKMELIPASDLVAA